MKEAVVSLRLLVQRSELLTVSKTSRHRVSAGIAKAMPCLDGMPVTRAGIVPPPGQWPEMGRGSGMTAVWRAGGGCLAVSPARQASGRNDGVSGAVLLEMRTGPVGKRNQGGGPRSVPGGCPGSQQCSATEHPAGGRVRTAGCCAAWAMKNRPPGHVSPH